VFSPKQMVAHAVLIALAPVVIIASLAMPAGIGGGLLYVPLLTVMGGVEETRTAAAMAQPMIVGATLAAICYNLAWQRRHPGRRLMEPELALAAIPPCLAGTLVGTLLNQVLPSAAIHLLLLLVLLLSIRNTLSKAVAMWRQESESKESSIAVTSAVALEQGSVPGANVVGAASHDSASASASVSTSEQPNFAPAAGSDRQGFDEGEASVDDTPHSAFSMFPHPDLISTLPLACSSGLRHRTAAGVEVSTAPPALPQLAPGSTVVASAGGLSATAAPRSDSKDGSLLKSWLMLLVVWGILVVSLILRGGKGSVSAVGVQMCSWEYWCITWIAFIFLLATGISVRRSEVASLTCFGIGSLSSVVGIGGGIVLNPMLLGAGLEPQVATATVTVMITMTSSNATINFILGGAIPLVPTVLLTAGTFVGSLCGKSVVGWLVSKTGRNSILVFMLAAFMAISTVAVAVQSVIETIQKTVRGENPLTEIGDICS